MDRADPALRGAAERTGAHERIAKAVTTASHERPMRGRAADAVAALLMLAAVPLAVETIPNTVGYALQAALADLGDGAGGTSAHALMRLIIVLFGLSLPALLVSLPLAARVMTTGRRVRAWSALLAGLTVFGVADLLGVLTPSLITVTAGRLLHGIGAGVILTATLALAWERPTRHLLSVWWQAILVAAMIVAPALALFPLAGGSWQDLLRPYPWLTGVALILVSVLAVLTSSDTHLDAHAATTSPLPVAGLLVPAGLAVLTVVATLFAWPPPLALAAAGAGLLGVAALAVGRTGRAGGVTGHALAMAGIGFAVLPTAMAVFGLLAVDHGLPGALRLASWPAALATLAAAAGAVVAARIPLRRRDLAVPVGSLVAGAGLLVAWDAPTHPVVVSFVSFALLAAGAGLAVGASDPGPAGAVLGLVTICSTALTGFLVLGAVQSQATARVAGRVDPDMVASALASGTRWWLVIAIVLIVVLGGGAFLAARRERAGVVDRSRRRPEML